ncbi:CHAP domain-containing protein [Lactococcus lactis]|nr:CHAP domain-containing protein [Lactococcus lactis]
MDEKQKQSLKKSIQVKQRANELLKKTVKQRPRQMRLTASKNVHLARKMLRLKRKSAQKGSLKETQSLNVLHSQKGSELSKATQKEVSEAKRELAARKLLLKKMRKQDPSYLPTQLKFKSKVAVKENLMASPASVLESDETLSDGVEKVKKVMRQERLAKQHIELTKSGGRVALRLTKRTYGLTNRTFNFVQGKGFTRTPDDLKLRKQLKRRYQRFIYQKKLRKEAKQAKKSTSFVMNLLRGKMSPKEALKGLAHNPVVWIASLLLFLVLMIVAAAADVPNPSIKQNDFELTDAWTTMTKLDADHSKDGNQFYTNFDGVMFYMNEKFDDYDVDGMLSNGQSAKAYLSDLWTALNGKAPNYELTTMDELERKGAYVLSQVDYTNMKHMISEMGYQALDGQLAFPYATDNLIINRRFGYEGADLHQSIEVTTSENQPIVAPLSGKVTVNSNQQVTIENTTQEEKVSLQKVDTSRLTNGQNISSSALIGKSLASTLEITLQKYDDGTKSWKRVNPAFYFPKVTYTQMTQLAANDYNPDSSQLASAQAIYNYAMAHGGTLNGVCAVLGNYQVEGNLDPTAVETIYDEPFKMGPRKQAAQAAGFAIEKMDAAYAARYPAIHQAGIGLGQWTNERDIALQSFAKAQKKPWCDGGLQIQFATTGDSPGAITALNNTLQGKVGKDLPTLTNYFLTYWEGNPGDKISERIQDAQNWQAYFTRAASGSSGKADVSVPPEYAGKLTEPAPNEQDVTGYPGNNYALNNCTWYVYNREYQLGNHIPANLGNGGQWGISAKVAGYATSSTPKVGNMASFTPGLLGCSSIYGHVAFVEYVNPDGSFLVSEMNVVDPGSGKISYRVISSNAGITFVDPTK